MFEPFGTPTARCFSLSGVYKSCVDARQLEFRDARVACNGEVCAPSLIRPLPPPSYAGSHASAWRAQDTGDIRCGSSQRCMLWRRKRAEEQWRERAGRPPARHVRCLAAACVPRDLPHGRVQSRNQRPLVCIFVHNYAHYTHCITPLTYPLCIFRCASRAVNTIFSPK